MNDENKKLSQNRKRRIEKKIKLDYKMKVLLLKSNLKRKLIIKILVKLNI